MIASSQTPATPEEAPDPLELGQYARFLFPAFDPLTALPWPPDVFGICMAILQKSAAYASVINIWPPDGPSGALDDSSWQESVRTIGSQWALSWGQAKRDSSLEPIPPEVIALWKAAFATGTQRLDELRAMDSTTQGVCHSLLQLCAIADEASAGFGIPGGPRRAPRTPSAVTGALDAKTATKFVTRTQLDADRILQRTSALKNSTLCMKLHPSRVRVLPKMHCPQSGLTIRSFSHNLAVYTGTEANPIWSLAPEVTLARSSEAMNLLVIPWPYSLFPAQIKSEDRLPRESGNLDKGNFGFFTVEHASTHESRRTPNPFATGTELQTFTSHVLQLIENAQFEVGPIQAVIFPELALSEAQYSAMKEALKAKEIAARLDRQASAKDKSSKPGPTPEPSEDWKIVLIAGVGTPSPASGDTPAHGTNQARVNFPLSGEIRQDKHHRWKLERNQIRQYGLGSRLHSERQWWEHISLSNRELNFFALARGLVATIQICEDLARPDPGADMIRAIGPNLVIALLMDGPQIKERWPARYATTLADDPGSSVLTVTSLGMARLSRATGSSAPRNSVVALWKDASGIPVEVELPTGYDGVVLTLTSIPRMEWSADGRNDGGTAVYPTLTGVRPIQSSDSRTKGV